ncbi:hypothetical protein NYZ00_19010, partial [Acinetobacter baumannii]|nr:hypothetical protein [Acinetobacter baumannii]
DVHAALHGNRYRLVLGAQTEQGDNLPHTFPSEPFMSIDPIKAGAIVAMIINAWLWSRKK